MDCLLFLLIIIGILMIVQLISMVYWEPSWRHFTDGDIGEGFLRVAVALIGALLVIGAIATEFFY